MSLSWVARQARWSLAAAVVVMMLPLSAKAQPTGAGVVVDANGVLRTRIFQDPTIAAQRERIAHSKASLSTEVQKKSPLRMISLNRLQKAIEAQIANDRKPTDEMRYLAGMTRLKHVFFYPETGDIVLAGPAEGWTTDPAGRVIGMESMQPAMELDDLVAALRAFPPGAKPTSIIGCSIDPTQEGLQRMQEFLRSIGGYATPGDTQAIVNGLRTSLGLQEVRVMGVSPETHFAQVMVEADYRMKLIGIGLEPPPVRMVTFIDRADASVARNALFRWYFIPNYQCLRVSDDRLAMELVGEGVKLVGEDEMVTQSGERNIAVTQGNRASEAFTTSFTAKFGQIAAKTPVYAQLRNLIDLSVAAAFIQEQDFANRANWNMDTLLNEETLPIETYQSPVQVDTAVASVWKGNRLLTPVAGGVTIQAQRALKAENLLPDADGQVAAARDRVDLKDLPADKWWWD